MCLEVIHELIQNRLSLLLWGCAGGLSLACKCWIFHYQLPTAPSRGRGHESLVSPKWSRYSGKQAVTHIWNRTFS